MKNNLERENQGQIHISVGSPLNIYSLTDDEYTTQEVAAILGFIVLGFGLAFTLIKRGDQLNKKRKTYDKKYLSPTYEEVQDLGYGYEDKNQKASEEFINKLHKIIDDNKYALIAERKRLIKSDAYGKINYDKWFRLTTAEPEKIILELMVIDKKFKEGLPYFWMSQILPAFSDKSSFWEAAEVFFEKYKIYCSTHQNLVDSTSGEEITRKRTENDWFDEIANYVEEICTETSNDRELRDKMTGIEFENYCKKILEESGWEVEDTPTTGDQGVDLIASIENLRVCIQCKCFAKAVGNKAVQEIASGMMHWKGTHAVVVAKSGFTKSAQTLAASTKVILTSDIELKDLENLVLPSDTSNLPKVIAKHDFDKTPKWYINWFNNLISEYPKNIEHPNWQSEDVVLTNDGYMFEIEEIEDDNYDEELWEEIEDTGVDFFKWRETQLTYKFRADRYICLNSTIGSKQDTWRMMMGAKRAKCKNESKEYDSREELIKAIENGEYK